MRLCGPKAAPAECPAMEHPGPRLCRCQHLVGSASYLRKKKDLYYGCSRVHTSGSRSADLTTCAVIETLNCWRIISIKYLVTHAIEWPYRLAVKKRSG